MKPAPPVMRNRNAVPFIGVRAHASNAMAVPVTCTVAHRPPAHNLRVHCDTDEDCVRSPASGAAGVGRSADRTLRTARPVTPRAPAASSGPIQGLTSTTVTVTGTVNPRGSATRYRFEYGTGTSLKRRLAYQDAGNATTALPVSAALSLAPNTRYSYRVVATNAGGTARGARRTFTTPRAAALLTMALSSNCVVHGAGVAVTGRATSGGAGRVTLALERQLFPFTGPFQQVGSTRRSARDGGPHDPRRRPDDQAPPSTAPALLGPAPARSASRVQRVAGLRRR